MIDHLYSQTDAMIIANSMAPGQCFLFTHPQMRHLAEGSIRSLLFDGPARNSDIEQFVRTTSENWNVVWHEDPFRRTWTMQKQMPPQKQLYKSICS